MPAVVAKKYLRMVFKDTADPEGWSEGYWMRSQEYLAAWNYARDVLFPARRLLMGGDSVLVDMVISDAAVRGDSYRGDGFPGEKAQNDNFNAQASVGGGSLPGNCCIYYLMQADDKLIRATRPLHAISGALVNFPPLAAAGRTPVGVPSADFANYFVKFGKALAAGTDLVRVIYNAAPTTQFRLVGNISAGVNVIQINPLWNVPKTGRFWFTVDDEVIGTLTRFEDNKFTVQRGVDSTTQAAHLGDTLCVGKTTAKIQDAPVVRTSYRNIIRYRKIGRPFDLLRGRRAARSI